MTYIGLVMRNSNREVKPVSAYAGDKGVEFVVVGFVISEDLQRERIASCRLDKLEMISWKNSYKGVVAST